MIIMTMSVMKYFDEKCKGSREIYEESQKYIPGGVQHNLAFNKPFPDVHGQRRMERISTIKDGNRIYRLPAGGRSDHPGQQLSSQYGRRSSTC